MCVKYFVSTFLLEVLNLFLSRIFVKNVLNDFREIAHDNGKL